MLFVVNVSMLSGCTLTAKPPKGEEHDTAPLLDDADSDTDADTDSDTGGADSGDDSGARCLQGEADTFTAHVGIDLDFVFQTVCASTFQMGCTVGQADCQADETEHTVALTHDYQIGRTEVTQGQYGAITGKSPVSFAECGPGCPVQSVSWHEAAAFANVLSADAGLEACYACTGTGTAVECDVSVSPYACTGYRLPTEAEWEGAARCGTDLRYSGSDSVADVAWTYENSVYGPNSVATLAPNACGTYDMSGNVWEWAQDWRIDDAGNFRTDYPAGAATDPTGADTGVARAIRGGAWTGGTTTDRVSRRHGAEPEAAVYDLGFRLARTLP